MALFDQTDASRPRGSSGGSVDRPVRAGMTGAHGEGPCLSREALAALAGRPGFDQAMIGVARGAVEQYRESWALNRILSDRGRVMAAFMALDLHYADGSRRGFTLAQLRTEAERHGFASRGRITAWAASLRLLRLLGPGEPGRPQRLVPTEAFFTMFRARMRRIWQSVALVHPPALQAIAALEHEAYLGHVAAGFMDRYRAGQRVFHGIPELADLAEREAGLCVLLSVMLNELAGERIAVAGLARDFAVSRAHIRAVLQEAEQLGLVTRHADGEYRANPRLTEWLRRFFAALFQSHIFAMDRALARFAEGAAMADAVRQPA